MSTQISARPPLLAVVAMALLFPCGQARGGNGDPVSGYPVWPERATIVLTNACRQGPTQYRDAYLPEDPGILQPAYYPPQPPFYYCLPLNQSARFHCEDMATNGCFQYNSCDGTAWNERIASFYSEQVAAEIIGLYPTPFAMVNAWISDSHAADGSGMDLHRAVIMHDSIREMGGGYTYSVAGSHHHYWTQDFGYGAVDYTTPLAWGSHVFTGDGNVTFMANYYAADALAPLDARLYVDDVPYAMSPTFGTAPRGTYTYALPVGSGCRTYYFRFLDAGGVCRLFPESGRLRTKGEGGCTEDYLAVPVDVPPTVADARAFALEPPAPNPARSRAAVRFTLPAASEATLRVFDIGGRLVRVFRMSAPAGAQEWTWDVTDARGRRVPDGIYHVLLEAAGRRAIQRIVVLDAR